MTPPDDADLLDLQVRLRADDNGVERHRLEERLQEMHDAVKRKLDAGATPAEFGTLNGMLDATQAAREIVGLVWKRFHSADATR